MNEVYDIKFTGQVLGYVRQVLGARPHDEVRQLIDSIEFQKREQDEEVAGPSPIPDRPVRAVRRGRKPVSHANGTGGEPVRAD